MLPFLLCTLMLTGSDAIINLPEPEFTNMSIEQCIQQRRSIRSFQDKTLSLQEISNLLWTAQGITDNERGYRATPSAGATYPLILYYATKHGLFRYIPKSHGVKQTMQKDVRKDIAEAALNQMFIADAGMVIVITAIFKNTTWRYKERGVRYVHIEVGHCAQNIHLEAVALGLGSVSIGAYHDDELKELLELDQEEPLYIIPVGYFE